MVSEIGYRHVTYKGGSDTPETSDQLYQFSFRGYNLTSPLQFKAGRFWTGSEFYRVLDGASFFFPWGRRLSSTVTLGRPSYFDLQNPSKETGILEGRLHYKFNENTVFAIHSGNDETDKHTTGLIGYEIGSLKILGELKNSGATESYRLGLQIINSPWIDVSSNVRVDQNKGKNTGYYDSIAGAQIGSCYLEGSFGSHYLIFRPQPQRNYFYESSLTWGRRDIGLDELRVGFLFESANASVSRTVSGNIEKMVSSKTRIILSLANTRMEAAGNSYQTLESRLFRAVDWGFFEATVGIITGKSDSSIDKLVSLRSNIKF